MDARSQLIHICEKRGRAYNLNLQGADLARADLSSLNADELDLSAADLCGAKLGETRFGGCRFEGAKLESSDWSGATLRLCVFDDAKATGACFDNARIEDSSAKGADLTRASLRSAKLTETTFARAVLRDAVLDDTEGDGVQLRGADLSGASLIGARFDDADFRGADLSRADLSRGRFRDADFRGAVLEGVRWADADFSGAMFDIGAGPAPEPASAPDSASPPPHEKEMGALAHLIEEFLKIAPRETFGESQRPDSPHLGERGDSTALRDFVMAFEKTLASIGLQGEEARSSVRSLLNVLETYAGNEPPDEWKPAIEQLLTYLPSAAQDMDLMEVLNDLLESVFQQSNTHTATEEQKGGSPQSRAESEGADARRETTPDQKSG